MDNLVTIRINASYGRTVTHATKGTYSFIRNNPTGTWYDNNYTATDIFPNTSASIAGYPYGGVYRGGLTFNLSAVPSGKPIVAGSINGYLSGKQNTIGNVSSGWIDYNPPNPMSYSYTNDMLRTTFVPYTYYQSYSRLGTANTSVSWKLTPAGIAANNLTNSNNMTSFAISSRWLTENITPDWWKTGGDEGFVGVRSPTYASGQYAPFINITYVNTGDGGSAPVSSFTVEDPVEHFPEPVVVNSTSTESPTAFNWSWGDGTWSNGTSANTTHEYLKRGKFAINLLASNAFGSNMTPAAATVRMVSYEIYD
jgi:hypothetical protein